MLGLFDSSHMPYNIDSDHAVKPTLVEMVGKALDVLEKDQKGYFLFVEGNVPMPKGKRRPAPLLLLLLLGIPFSG